MKKSVEIELNKIMDGYKWKNIKDIDWKLVCLQQDLSEDFMKEFKNNMWWKFISHWCYLSDDFIKELKDKLDLDLMLHYKKISYKFYKELTYVTPLLRYEILDFS